MTKVVGVRFKTSGRIYYFDPLDLEIGPEDGVIVETARGTEFADVARTPHEVEDSEVVQPLKPIIRVATAEDRRTREENARKEKDAFEVCQKKIQQHGLDMKLVDVEYSFGGSKVVFYFTADERVDFRELVRDLASQFRTRIELRQIGVRDEAKMLGGLGSCGRPVCCKTFLDDFHPVSIKMAKEQNLSLSPTKISGLCGRLMCCLQYEQAAYEETKKKMPRTGREIQTPDGTGIAVENNAITERTRVRLTLPDGTIEMREYHYSQLAKPGEPLPDVPAPVPVRRERERAEGAIPSGQYVPPEMPAQAQPQTAEDGDQTQQRRRRRGGRRHGGGQGAAQQGANGAPADGAAPRSTEQRPQGGAGQRNGGQSSQRQPRRDDRRTPAPSGKQPEAGALGNTPANAAAGEGAQNPTHRRRRRGGRGRSGGGQGGSPRPEQPVPGGEG